MSVNDRVKYVIKRYISNTAKRKMDNHAKELLEPNDVVSREFIKEAKKYWKSKYNVSIGGYWHALYSLRNGQEDVRFIDDSVYISYMQFALNKIEHSLSYGDKNNYDVLFKDVNRPKTIIRNMNGDFLNKNGTHYTIELALKECCKYEKIIIKPAIESGSGRGISVLENDDTEKFFNKLKQEIYKQKENFIVQEYMQQHKDLAELNASTVNTVRVLSLNFDGEIHILPCVIRVGTPEVDILYGHNDCYVYGIDQQGKLLDRCVDDKLRNVDYKPLSGKYIPNYKQIIDIVRTEHHKIPYVKYIGWDFSVDSAGEPCLIEINTYSPGVGNSQALGGPLFGELTEDVSNYVFKKCNLSNTKILHL